MSTDSPVTLLTTSGPVTNIRPSGPKTIADLLGAQGVMAAKLPEVNLAGLLPESQIYRLKLQQKLQ